MRGRKQCRRRYVVPKDPRTPPQLRVRAALGAASRSWSHSRQITDQERDTWEASANQVQSRPRLAQSGPLTGQQYFVGRQCAKARSDGPPPSGHYRESPRFGAVLSSLPARLPGGPQLAPRRSVPRTTWDPRRTGAGPTRGHRQRLASRHRVRERRLAIATSPGSGQRPMRLPAPGGPSQARPACCSGACPAQFPCGSRSALGRSQMAGRRCGRAVGPASTPVRAGSCQPGRAWGTSQTIDRRRGGGLG